MAAMMENVKTVNSVLRTLIATVIVGGLGVGSWVGYRTYNAADIERQEAEGKLIEFEQQIDEQKQTIAEQLATLQQKEDEIAQQLAVIADKDTQIDELNVDIEEKKKEITRLDTAMRLLKVDHRLAEIKVIDVAKDDDGPYVDVTFQEIGEEGQPIDEMKEFRLRGDEIRVDSWVVQFDDKYVEQQDLDRSTSILLFKKIYGNAEAADEGHIIESIGTRPTAYARGKPLSEFEKKIWDDFWMLANDEEQANAMGIRDAGGVGVYKKAIKGKTYIVKLRASGGPTLD
ncbi:MAG: hypothetical protein RIC55_33060 [Pirellulaceae bacterium]